MDRQFPFAKQIHQRWRKQQIDPASCLRRETVATVAIEVRGLDSEASRAFSSEFGRNHRVSRRLQITNELSRMENDQLEMRQHSFFRSGGVDVDEAPYRQFEYMTNRQIYEEGERLMKRHLQQ